MNHPKGYLVIKILARSKISSCFLTEGKEHAISIYHPALSQEMAQRLWCSFLPPSGYGADPPQCVSSKPISIRYTGVQQYKQYNNVNNLDGNICRQQLYSYDITRPNSCRRLWQSTIWETNKCDTARLPKESEVCEYCEMRHCLSSDNGLVLDRRIVISKTQQRKVLYCLHSAHQGVIGMKACANESVYWPMMDASVHSIRASCMVCSNIPTPSIIENFSSSVQVITT